MSFVYRNSIYGEAKIWRDENKKKHRLGDRPAKIDGNGIYYIIHGNLHRDNGKPAIIFRNGDRAFLVNNDYHRLDGPAIESKTLPSSYYLFGFCLSEKRYWAAVKELKRLKNLE